jgi:lipopolysaccharide/colanic/teichoic acid biosynthesis glycosyltransferase
MFMTRLLFAARQFAKRSSASMPCDLCSSEQFARILARERARSDRTCIWQVEGRSKVSFADWVRMDVKYVRSRSLGGDLKLLLQTVPAVVSRRGAS